MGHLTDHIVICNWSEQARRVVDSVHSALFEGDEGKWCPVVVVAENVDCFPDEPCFEDTLLVPGSPMQRSLLRRANVQDARAVVILADEQDSSADDRTLQIALSVRSILREEKRQHVGETRVVAEVLDAKRAPNFRKSELTGIHEVICESDLSVRVIAQTNLSPGLTFLLSDILEYDADENDIYMVDLPAEFTYVGERIERFSELVRYVGDHTLDEQSNRPALLLGLRRARPGEEEVLLVNPTRSKLSELGPLETGDSLIVLARDPMHAGMVLRARSSNATAVSAADGA